MEHSRACVRIAKTMFALSSNWTIWRCSWEPHHPESADGSLDGRAIGLLGPNGAGKSTLINTLLGFHSAAPGTARIFGSDIGMHGRGLRRLIGYMPESDSFIADMRQSGSSG